jgi:hypothetical protein
MRHPQKTRRVPPRWRVVLVLLLLLFIFFYFMPIAFEDPGLHTFAASVRTGDTPVVFIHGLGSAPDSFFEFQERLEADGLYVNGMDNFNKKDVCDYAHKHAQPMSFAVSFYPTQTGRSIDRLGASLLNSVSGYVNPQMTLDSYVSMLNENINDVLAKLLPKMSVVRKVIFLGTPQSNGIYGNKTLDVGLGVAVSLGDVQQALDQCKRSSGRNIIYSTLLSHDLSQDCQVLEWSLLLQTGIESLNRTVSTVAGDIDGQGDGLVKLTAVQLPSADNHVVNCEHNTLHSPGRCPTAYDEIKRLLAPGAEGQKTGIRSFYDALLRLKLAMRVEAFGS